MSWFKKPKPQLPIPPYVPVPEFKRAEPKDPGIVVEEREMSATGIFRIFGKRPEGK